MIYFDDDTVKIGGVILPGIYKSIEVNHDAQIDEQDVEGSSRKPKQASGYDDARITIEISLQDSETVTKEEKLLMIQDIFRGAVQEKPVVHELISIHSSIRGIQNVIIKNMTSKETNKKDEIVVNLELLQYDTVTISASKKKKKKSDKGSEGSSSGNSLLTEEYKSYQKSDRGSAPKQSNKTSKTPAVDK